MSTQWITGMDDSSHFLFILLTKNMDIFFAGESVKNGRCKTEHKLLLSSSPNSDAEKSKPSPPSL